MTAAANSLPFPHQRQLREVSLNHRRDSTARELAEKRASVVVIAVARPTAGCGERAMQPQVKQKILKCLKLTSLKINLFEPKRVMYYSKCFREILTKIFIN